MNSNQFLENPNTPYNFIRVASPNGCAFTAAYVPCPKDQANRSSLKWAPSSSSTCNCICSSEPIWLSHMNPHYRHGEQRASTWAYRGHKLEIHVSSPTFVVLSWFLWLQIIRHSHQYLQPVQHKNWLLLAQRPITLVLMMINSCSYSSNDLVFN